MSLNAAQKAEIMREFQRQDKDTGSSEVQIALLTARIKRLTEHLKSFKKDFHTRRGLSILVSQRRRLLKYIKNSDYNLYIRVVNQLGLRY